VAHLFISLENNFDGKGLTASLKPRPPFRVVFAGIPSGEDMNHRPKHSGAHPLSPNYRPRDGATHALQNRSETSNRAARQVEPSNLSLPDAGDPVCTSRPAFHQPQQVSFVSLSERISRHTECQAPSFQSSASTKLTDAGLLYRAVTKIVRAVGHNPQNLVLSTLLMLLAGAVVHFFVTG
jgi:hypothetical protein